MFRIETRIVEAKSGGYDIIHSFDHFPNIAIPFYLLRNRIKAQWVNDWVDLYGHGGLQDLYGYRLAPLYRKINWLPRRIVDECELDIRAKSDGITVISEYLAKMAKSIRNNNDHVYLIPGGCDPELVKPVNKKVARRKLGLPPAAKIVGFLGRGQFDVDFLIKAFSIVSLSNKQSLLLIIGPTSGLMKRFLEIVRESALENKVIFVGRCSNNLLPIYLGATDVLTLPLRDNPANQARWPNKIGEYMASGRPSVVCNVGDVARVVARHKVGLVCQPETQDFADKINFLLNDENLTRELGANARKVACENYTWKALTQQLLAAYEKILS